MSGRRLLDLITLVNVSRNVAGKHIGIRSRQLDVHSRTSSLTKELKSQVDNISRAAQAAADLARRLNESQPSTPPTEEAVEENVARETQDIIAREAERTGQSVSDSFSESPAQRHEDAAPSIPDTIGGPTREELAWRESLEAVQRPPQVAATSRRTQTTESTNNGGQEEPSDEVVGQLFRSRRVGRSVFGRRGLEDLKKPASDIPGVPSREASTDIPRIRDMQPGSQSTVSSTTTQKASVSAKELLEEIPTIEQVSQNSETIDTSSEKAEYQMVESRVPSSRIGRLWEYGGLAASMAFGVLGEGTRRLAGGNDGAGSLLLSPGNIERLVNKLSKMRGAALKMGQMMSFQGKYIPSLYVWRIVNLLRFKNASANNSGGSATSPG